MLDLLKRSGVKSNPISCEQGPVMHRINQAGGSADLKFSKSALLPLNHHNFFAQN